MARRKVFTLARRWTVALASVTFIMLASLTDSSAATDRAFRWIGDPRRAIDAGVMRRGLHTSIPLAGRAQVNSVSQEHRIAQG